MIGQIGPLVKADRKNRLLAFHVIGGAIGGAVTGLALGFIAALFGVAVAGDAVSSFELLIVASVLIVSGLADLRLLGFPGLLQIERQTPKGWSCTLGHSSSAFLWGGDLGLGVTTKLPAMTFAVLPVLCIVMGSFGLAVLVMTVYGSSRALAVTAGIVLSRRDVRMPFERLLLREDVARAAAGMVGIVIASSLISLV